MARAAPTPLDAGLVQIRKGEAQPHAAPEGRGARPAAETRIGIAGSDCPSQSMSSCVSSRLSVARASKP